MKKVVLLLRLLFFMSAMLISQFNRIPVRADSSNAGLQVITPQNVKNLKLFSYMGLGTYSGDFDLQTGGNLIAAITASGVVLLDRDSGKEAGFIAMGLQPTAVSISPDGQTLAVVYNTPTGKLINASESGVSGPEYERRIRFFSLPDRQPVGGPITDLQQCAHSNIWQIAYTPDGKSLVFEKKYGNTEKQKLFCALSVNTGKVTHTLDIPPNAISTVSPDGRYVALSQLNQEGQTGKASIYASETFKQIAEIIFPMVKWPEILFTGKGIFAVLSYEGEVETVPHSVRLWTLPEGTPLTTVLEEAHYKADAFSGVEKETYDRIMSVDVSPDGLWLASGSQNGKVKLWDVKSGQLVKEFGTLRWNSTHLTMNRGGALSDELNSYIKPVRFSSDGKMLVAAESLTTLGQSGQIHVYRVPDGQETSVWKGPSLSEETANFDFSPDSSKVVYGGLADGSAEVHNVVDGGLVLRLVGHSAPINQAIYSADGNWIATASDDNTIRIWKTSNGQAVHTLAGHTARVNLLTFSPDSQWLLSGADDNTLRRWRVNDGSLLETRQLGNENWRVEFLSILKDNRTVVFNTIKYPSPLTGYVTKQMLWDVESGKETPIGANKVNITMMGQDGKTFVGYKEGNVLGTLDLTGKMTLFGDTIRSPYGNGALSKLALSPDGNLLFSGNGYGLHAWSINVASVNFLGLIAQGEAVPSYGQAYRVSPDGKILAFENGGVLYLMGVPQQ